MTKLKTRYPHHNPWIVKVELVYGCTRFCDFCPFGSIIADKPHKMRNFMDVSLAKDIAKEIGAKYGQKRIEFATRGEALLHPKLMKILKIFKKYAPKTQLLIATNGDILRKNGVEYIRELFENGLNILAVDAYDHEKELYKLGMQSEKDSPIRFIDAYKENFSAFTFHSYQEKFLVYLNSISEVGTTHPRTRKLYNNGGNVDFKLVEKYGLKPLKVPLYKKCTRPDRELIINYDGVIPLCCVDWRNENVMGKYPDDGSLQDIWEGTSFTVMRSLLLDKNRTMRPCYKCDYVGGFRQGFLKDPFEGKQPKLEEMKDCITANAKKYSKYVHPTITDPIFWEPHRRPR